MIDFNANQYKEELKDILRLFVPFLDMELSVCVQLCDGECAIKIADREYTYVIGESDIIYNTDGEGNPTQKGKTVPAKDKNQKKFAKISLYNALSDYFNKKLPWGALTGVRPVSLFYRYLDKGYTVDEANEIFTNQYRVSPQKTQLTADIIKSQTGYLHKNSNKVNLYVHIPFCPDKCGYCSFLSLPYAKNIAVADKYFAALITEIIQTKALLTECGREVLSVYIGGGTPSVLSAEQLSILLKTIDISGVEYTLEAGRPETITTEKLRVMVDGGVNRLCVNPQTFCDDTLKRIGRGHTSYDIATAISLAKQFPFVLNMDLIAGLPGENLQIFAETLNKTLDFCPQNVTVHTLSIKRGGALDKHDIFNDYTCDMVDLAASTLDKAGYVPYYLYRQKNMSQSLDNTGYCLNGTQSVNNITVMEETVSVIACGAGAITKIVGDNRIDRYAMVKDVKLYLDNFLDKLANKLFFIKNQFTN